LEIKGIVSAVSHKDGRYGIKIGTEWFNGFGPAGCNKGDEVLLVFEKDDKWNNVETVTVVSAGTTSSVGTSTSNQTSRTNVDAGNILQRAIELLNSSTELTFAQKHQVLKEGKLTEDLVQVFRNTKTKLSE